jgi:hypothetical protein
MKVAIMQPYFLPYIGYWHLVASVDKFVLLDDVNYINRGWINRNQIMVNGTPTWLTLPIQRASQNRLIFELELTEKKAWQANFEKTIQHAYARAPYFKDGFALFKQIMDEMDGNLSESLSKSISSIVQILGLTTELVPTSRTFPKGGLTGQERILDICKRLGATEYVNAPGGHGLYEDSAFLEAGVKLCFLSEQSAENELRSGSANETPLSILDTLMYNSFLNISSHLLKNCQNTFPSWKKGS